ncbi:hypothetical protein EV126DRAFT_70702 [Verticillium dahliae]|nr:hypothetical protein EV126DRAFT_70702 [Verticillium dahliae]
MARNRGGRAPGGVRTRGAGCCSRPPPRGTMSRAYSIFARHDFCVREVCAPFSSDTTAPPSTNESVSIFSSHGTWFLADKHTSRPERAAESRRTKLQSGIGAAGGCPGCWAAVLIARQTHGGRRIPHHCSSRPLVPQRPLATDLPLNHQPCWARHLGQVPKLRSLRLGSPVYHVPLFPPLFTATFLEPSWSCLTCSGLRLDTSSPYQENEATEQTPRRPPPARVPTNPGATLQSPSTRTPSLTASASLSHEKNVQRRTGTGRSRTEQKQKPADASRQGTDRRPSSRNRNLGSRNATDRLLNCSSQVTLVPSFFRVVTCHLHWISCPSPARPALAMSCWH